MVVGAEKLANVLSGSSFKILKGGGLTEIAGHSLTAAAAFMTVADGATNGWKNHHTADLVIDGVTTGIEIAATVLEFTTPVGWIIGGGLFVGNLISYAANHKSLTENLFDK